MVPARRGGCVAPVEFKNAEAKHIAAQIATGKHCVFSVYAVVKLGGKIIEIKSR